MSKAQASIEYVLSLSILLLMFIAMYQLSFDMNLREQYLVSLFEGEKTAAKLSNTINWALILGNGSNISVRTHSNPSQILIASQAQVLSFGTDNRTVVISSTLANATSYSGAIQSNQILGVSYDGTNVTISQQ